MAGTVVTTWTLSARQEIAQGIHDFTPSVTTANNVTVSSNTTVSGINAADMTLFRVGAVITHGNNLIPTSGGGTVIASIASTSSVIISQAATGTSSAFAVTIAGDTFKLALFTAAASMSRTFDRDQTNAGTPGTGAASTTNMGTDEVANGSGYTSGGVVVAMETGAPKLTAGSGSPSFTNSGVYWNLSANPNWTTATFSSRGCMVYSTRVKQGNSTAITANATSSALNKALALWNFTTDQSVSSGTFTVVMPVSGFTTAMFAIG